MSENRTRPRHRHDEENVPTQKGKMFCAGFCFAFFNFLGKIFRKWLTIRQSAGIITPVVRHGTDIWGISSAGRALAWHARGHRFDPGILHQKALYFVGSMVLFFLLEPVFGGCIASPAPFSGICRRFLYNPQLLTLHHFQKECLPPVFSAGCRIIPFNRRSKRRWSPTIREAAAFVDYRISQP